MKLFSKTFLNPAGGVTYHLTALRYRSHLWKPFRKSVDQWLKSWKTTQSELIIFGPSAGWTISKEFLSRFEKIVCVEPDPLARILFRLRFAGLPSKIEFVSDRNILPWLSLDDGATLQRFLTEKKSAAILFANLLGQMQLLLPEPLSREKENSAQKAFFKALKDREWASYHDLFSSETKPEKPPMKVYSPTIEITAKLFPAGASLIDHGMLWFSEDREAQIEVWNLSRERHHVICFLKCPAK